MDLLLLDIEMPGMSGLELTRNLRDKSASIIFTTSKKEYAAEAFELNVADYLVKPITPARFIQAIERARQIIESNTEEMQWGEDEFLFVRDSSIGTQITAGRHPVCRSNGRLCKTTYGREVLCSTYLLRSPEERLPGSRFIRIHRSFMVAVDKTMILCRRAP